MNRFASFNRKYKACIREELSNGNKLDAYEALECCKLSFGGNAVPCYYIRANEDEISFAPPTKKTRIN